jgi:surface protein
MKKKLLKRNVLKVLLLCFVLLNKGSFAQFVTVWKTDNAGTSASNQITIPTNTSYTYSYTVNWGDASSNTYVVNTPPTHTYATPGTYTVSITGDFPCIKFAYGGDRLKLLSIDNWGIGTWKSFNNGFNGCSNVVGTFTASPILGAAADLSYMFAACSVFNTNISNWNVSTVINMSGMFSQATAFNQPIGAWNVGAVTNMFAMFYQATAFNQPIGTWNVGAVTDMRHIFNQAIAFNQPIGSWNVSAVTNMSFMFSQSSTFNQPIGIWNVGAVTDMSFMFNQSSAFNQSISTWNVVAVTNMSGMFKQAIAFNQTIGAWNVGAVTNMSQMFVNATAFNQPIGAWNVGAVTNMFAMFQNNTAFNQPIGAWNVGAVTDMIQMFYGATAFNQPIGTWNVGTVIDMNNMFRNAIAFNQPIGSWNVSNVTSMSNMFLGATLSNPNYHNLLIGWDALTLKPSVSFHGGNSKYCSAAATAARLNMISSDLWVITDGGTSPTPTITVNSGPICAGQSFTMVPSGAVTYTYSNGSSIATPTANASYNVIGTSSLGCVSSNTAVASVTVNPSPTIAVNSGAICSGQSFTMVPSGAVTYTYSNGSPVATPTANTTYSVSGTAINGCISANAISTVTVNARPTIAVNSGVICSGQSFTMVPSGALTYTYSNGSSIATPTANTTYSVSGTAINGCISLTSAASSVTVNALPTIAVNSGAICSGQSFTMAPSGAVTYTYSNGSSVATPTANASYNVIGTSSLGCVSSNTAVSSVTVNALPTIAVNSGAICSGQTFTMLPTGALTYTYSNGSSIATPTVNSTYSVSGTDVNGCVSLTSAASSVTVNTLPTLTVNSGAICSGQSFTMLPTGALTYTYSNGSSIATPTTNTTYSVSGTDVNGCVSLTSAASSITVNALPTVLATTNNTLLCSGQTVSLTATGASSYTWNTTATTPVIAVSPTVTETYTVTGTDVNGCSNLATVTQDVSLCTGIYSQMVIQNSPFVIYPNPNNGLFILELTTNANVTITNALGQIVNSEMLETGKHPIDISNEASGVYFVKVIENNQQHIQKVIKQ